MKSKLLFLSLFVFFSISASHAQISHSSAGIAVQGIARDEHNAARTDETIALKFTIYYKNASGVNTGTPFTQNKTLTTDAFGVFSHTIVPTTEDYSQIANFEAWLKIEYNDLTISDERLNHVPYAISANYAFNGVPTGSIMPFIGTTAPPGWVLCNGQSLTSIEGSETLIGLVGNNAPNLQGMFLRGTGTSPVNSQDGPALKGTQGEAFKIHDHPNDITVATDGSHAHTFNDQHLAAVSGTNYYGGGSDVSQIHVDRNILGGTHTHALTGSVKDTGGNETRPVSYGVNYIIKL